MLTALLCLLPAILLAVLLLTRRYPGERALLALRGTSRPRRTWPRERATPRGRGRTVVAVIHGSQLIGFSLAVRPPPVSHAAS